MRGPIGTVGPLALAAVALLGALVAPPGIGPTAPGGERALHAAAAQNDSAVGNFSSALGRIVTLLGVAGGAVLSIVWARVALSWFSNDISKKVQAKDRARDALVGTLLFTAALTGLLWGLARWVLTGS